MIYKYMNKLFGYDYVQWRNLADEGVARVFVAGDGQAYYWRYKNIKVVDIIRRPEDVIWLTCDPAKYLKYSALTENGASK